MSHAHLSTEELLRALHVELSARAEAIRSGATVPSGGISFGKRVGEGTSIAIERFTDVAFHGQLMQQLALVDAAIERIEEGTYGYCEETGEPISLKRLEARPIATLSVEAQERHERMERTRRDEGAD